MRFLFASQQGSSAAPVVSSVSASTGEDWDTATAHTITGTGFVSGCTCTIGGVSTTSLVFTNSTTLQVTMPARTLASTVDTLAVNVVVTNPDTQTSGASGNNAFTYSWSPYSMAADAWWRPDKGATTGAGTISALTNSGAGGTNYNLAVSGGAQADYSASDAAWNNKSSMNFDTSTKNLQTTAINISTALTTWVVADLTTASTLVPLDLKAAVTEWTVYKTAGNLVQYSNGGSVSGGAATGKTLAIGVFNGASSVLYQNSRTSTGTGTTSAMSAMTKITLGTNYALGAPSGKIVDAGIILGAMSTNNVARLCTYVARYGLSIP